MSATGNGPFFGIYSGDAANRPTIAWDANGGIGTPTAKPYQMMKLTLKRTAEVNRLPDPNGQVMGYNIRKRMRTLNVSMVVRAGSSAGAIAAAAAAAALLPPDLTKVVIDKTIATTGNTSINGDWIYETDGEWTLTPDGEAELTFDLVQHLDDTGAAISVATTLAALT